MPSSSLEELEDRLPGDLLAHAAGPHVEAVLAEGHHHQLDGLTPAAWLHLPGTTSEEVEGFPDLDSAVKGLRRLEKGFENPVPPVSSSPPPLWVTATPCRIY